MKVLIIGPSIERTRGGMATVIKDMLSQKHPDVQFEHIVSHVEGSLIEKFMITFTSLFRFIRRKGVDIVHIHVASGASIYRKSLFVFASWLLNRAVIIHAHGGDFHNYYNTRHRITKFFIRKTFSLCQCVLVLTPFWKLFFEQHITRSKVMVLHNGVQTQLYQLCFTKGTYANRFLYLGRLEKQKGIYDLLAVADRLVNKDGIKHIEFLLGGYGDVEAVEKIIKDKNLGDQIKLLGWVDDKAKIEVLKKIETLLLPSYYEGLPIAILEAMAAGKVIISTAVGGIPDLVKNKINGFLFSPGDTELLHKHILYVLANREEMGIIQKNNMEVIERDYDLKRIQDQLVGIYRNILKKGE